VEVGAVEVGEEAEGPWAFEVGEDAGELCRACADGAMSLHCGWAASAASTAKPSKGAKVHRMQKQRAKEVL
jgi:hypothetical protein